MFGVFGRSKPRRHKHGVLTDEEFQAAKAKVLGEL